MVSEVIQIEVREDGSRAVSSNMNALADSTDKAGTANDALQKILTQVSSTMSKVDSTLDRLNGTLAAQTSALAKATTAAGQASAASTKLAQSADSVAEAEGQAEARIKAVVTASLAQVQASNQAAAAASNAAQAAQSNAQANQQAGAAAQAAARSYTASAGAAVAQAREVESLNDALNGGIKNIEQWRNVEGALVDAQQRGIITGTQYNRMIAQLDGLLPTVNASLEKERAAVAGLVSSYDPLSAKLQKLEKDEQTLTSLRQKGLVTLDQYKRLMDGISAQRLVVQGAEEEAQKLNKFGEASAGAKREFGVLIGELARGNFAALEGSAITLANRMNLLEKAFSATGLAVGIFVGVLAGLAVALIAGYEQEQKLNAALIVTGNTSGQTAASINLYAQALTDAGKSSADNIALLTQLVATGRTTSGTFQEVGAAASNAMKLTGESVDKVVADFEPLYTDPIRWADDMDQKWHFLSLDARDHAQKLVDVGDTYGAVKIIANEFADNTNERTKEMIDNVGTLERAWRSVGDYLGRVKQFYADIGKESSSLQQFEQAKANYLEWQQKVKAANVDIYDPKNNDALANGTRLWNLMKDARDKVVGEQAFAQAKEQQDQQRKSLLDAGKNIDSINDKTQKQITLQNKLNQLKADYQKLNLLDPTNERLKGVSFDANGNPSGGAYASKVTELTQQANGKPKAPSHSQATDRDAAALARQENEFDRLRGTIDPTRAALDQLTKAQALYSQAVENGWIDQKDADFELAQYQLKLQDTINPLQALNAGLDRQIDSFGKLSSASKAQQSAEKDRQSLLQQGVILTDAEVEALTRKYEIVERNSLQQQVQDKVVKSAISQTQEQIDQLKILNDLKAAGTLNQDQVNSYEYKQNTDLFAGTGFGMQEQLKQQQQYYELVDALRQQDVLSEQDAAIAKQNIDRQTQKIRLSGTEAFLTTLTQLSSSQNKTQAGIGKAAAIAMTTINTYQAAQNAYASASAIPFVGWILGPIAAAAAVAAGLAQVAQIRSVNTTAGYMAGGYTGDGATNQVAGVVHGKEWVSNAATTARYRPQLEAMHNGTFNPDAPGNGTTRSEPVVIPPPNNRFIFVRNDEEVKNYMQSEDGERIVVQHMRNNSDN
jgi:hypothetical protein